MIKFLPALQDAELKAKGKKRDVKSLFTSKSSLKKQAVKMSAKQDESDIKSTGARNDYLLSLVTANAHQATLPNPSLSVMICQTLPVLHVRL
jgi:hypothetical protein